MKTTPVEIRRLLARLGPERVVLEVGTPAGWVHDVASGLGMEVQVANPNHEGWRWRNVKRKTDRLDALKLAQLSAVDQLPQVHMPQQRTREQRALIGYRCKLVSRRTRIKNTTSPGLYVQGLLIHGDMDDVIKLAGERLTVQYRIDADGRVVAP